jgi:hypothetical protein
VITPEEAERLAAIVRIIETVLFEEHEAYLPWLARILGVGCGMFTPWRTLSRVRMPDGSPASVLPGRKLLA